VQPNPRKTRTFRHLGQVDIAPLKEAVLALTEEQWNAENADKPNRFEALDVTRHIVFRFVANYRDWRDSYDRPLWDEWKHLLLPVMEAATADYGYARGVYPRVMLARMAAGGVPIVTNDQVIFRVEGAQYVMPEGEAVEVNNMGVHAVENRGATDRIHLIFEYYDPDQPDPDWLGAVLEAAR
jgi:Aspartyl/Asparaginyl beta-hydroxylase